MRKYPWIFLAAMPIFLLAGVCRLPAAEIDDEIEQCNNLLRALYTGDAEAIQAKTATFHPFAKDFAAAKEFSERLISTTKIIGNLEEIVSTEIVYLGNQRTAVHVARFGSDFYRVYVFVTSDLKFQGLNGPLVPLGFTVPELTHEQMLVDYDYMVEVLRDAMPHVIPIKEGYGVDAQEKLAGYRKQITPETSRIKFVSLLKKALLACKGHHLRLNENQNIRANPFMKKLYEGILTGEDCDFNVVMLALSKYLYTPDYPVKLPLLYWDGAYYTSSELKINETVYPRGMRLVALDDRPIEDIERSLQDVLLLHDNANKKFYWYNGILNDVQPVTPGVGVFDFVRPDGEPVRLIVNKDDSIGQSAPANPIYSTPKNVLYLAELNALYIRVPSMNPNDLPFYEKEISEILKENQPRTAYIDIRRNGGGSDRVATRILQMISAHPLVFNIALGIPANERISQHMARLGSNLDKAEKQRIPFLGDQEFYVGNEGGIMQPAEGATVEQIYVIAHDVFSAAGTLVMIAHGNKHITSVGMSSPMPLGRGIDPYQFRLPNSGIIAQVEPLIDLTGCENAVDCLHLDVEEPVMLTVEEYLKYSAANVPADPAGLTEYLLKEDPFMKKAISLSKE